MNQTQPTWQEIKKANSFGESVNLANRRYKLGNLPHDGGKLSCVDPIWTKENASSVGECIKEGVGYGLKASVIPAALFGISALATGGTSLAAGVFGVGSVYVANKLIGAMATRHKRDGWLLENPEPKKEPVKAPEMPVDMDDGNGKWWGQDVQDALDAHFTKFTEVTNMVDSVEGIKVPVVSVKTDRLVHVVAMTEAVNVKLFELEARNGFDSANIAKAVTTLSRDLKLPKGSQIMVEDNIGNGRIGLFVPKPKIEYKDDAGKKLSYVPFSASKKHLIGKLPWAVGMAVSGEFVTLDLTKMPHMIVGGETESGKSVGLMMGILSMASAVSPLNLRLHLADPKESSMPMLERLPHVSALASNAKKMVPVLIKVLDIYAARKAMWKKSKVQDANDLEKLGHHMPYHVVVIEEAATLIRDKTPVPGEIDENGKELKSTKTYGQWCEELLLEIANKGRAARIHLILATQYFAKSIFDSELVANITAGICYRVDAYTSSKMVVKQAGGEKLMGNGDCLVKHKGIRSAIRCQGVYMDTPEIEATVTAIRKQWMPEIRKYQQAKAAKHAA